MLGLVVALVALDEIVVNVSNRAELAAALSSAKPGHTILIAPGEYQGNLWASNLRGTKDRKITIAGSDKSNPPRIRGGSTGIQLSQVSHLEIRDLSISGISANGINIDDGGSITSPSHHITLKRITVGDLPQGNHDGIKLSGVDDFAVEECKVSRWGGSGIDMVGCHRGAIKSCEFREGADSGVQAKGGSSEIRIESCLFVNGGQRGVNIGGSTGAAFFRPSLQTMGNMRYEAKQISVNGCMFVGGGAAVAFVGVDGADVSFNTMVNPSRWVMRILQETTDRDFVPCQYGQFTDNLVVFTSSNWSAGGVNVGPNTRPTTFRFARNFWFCADSPDVSRPTLPMPEQDGVYGVNPQISMGTDNRVEVLASSSAKQVGAHAWKRS